MVTIRNIENPFKLDQAEIKELTYSRGNTIRDFLDESGFDYKDKRIIVSGRKIDDLGRRLDRGDEIIIIPEVKATAPRRRCP